MKPERWIAAAGLLLLGTAAHADIGVPLSFLDAQYVHAQAKEGDADADGFSATARFALAPWLFLQGGAGYAESDAGFGVTAESTSASLGLGLRLGIGAATDLELAANTEYADVEQSGFGLHAGDDDVGHSLRIGLRTLLLDSLEGGLDLNHIKIFGSHQTGASVYGVFYPLPTFGLLLRYGVNDDTDTIGVGVRWNP